MCHRMLWLSQSEGFCLSSWDSKHTEHTATWPFSWVSSLTRDWCNMDNIVTNRCSGPEWNISPNSALFSPTMTTVWYIVLWRQSDNKDHYQLFGDNHWHSSSHQIKYPFPVALLQILPQAPLNDGVTVGSWGGQHHHGSSAGWRRAHH